MTYELAKELKDAGFPNYRMGVMATHDEELLEKDWETYRGSYSPTLSELIEACMAGKFGVGVDHFAQLNAVRLESLDIEWEAWSNMNVCAKGSTPEEAVAKLWLALNKK